MKITALFTMSVLACSQAFAGTTITYAYDKQHRLTSADYSAAQTDAHVACQCDTSLSAGFTAGAGYVNIMCNSVPATIQESSTGSGGSSVLQCCHRSQGNVPGGTP